MSDKEIEKIEPVDFDISKSPLFSENSAQPESNKPSMKVWLSLGFLLIIALAVIFVLPTLVKEYELPLERRVEVADLTVAAERQTNQPAINAVSPFDEAQRSIQRKEAQDVLAELLTLQADLGSKRVEDWGNDEYQDALEFARTGDEDYLEQNFIGARDSYEEGRLLLQSILDRVPTVLDQHLIDGEAALIANHSALALEKFSIAIALDLDNAQAEIGLSRAENLDDVNNLLAEAEDLLLAGELESARDRYLSALDLDERNSIAQQQLQQVNLQIQENQFSAVMSEGYGFLQGGQPEQAIATFQRAANLGINRNQAEAAIQQTRDEVARVEIERLRINAEEAAAVEQWQEAIQAYNAVLDIDPNIIFAQEGSDYTGKRFQLDQLLENAIANPERLADDSVYQQTLDVYYTGRSLENAGSRLTGQLDQLEVLLENSQIPHEISLVSDNITQVTLLRIAELGAFESQSVTLKPGRYVAVGVREGYRDVRQEFVVGFGQTPASIEIKCDERIVATRGR